jgi:hypothetical protein
MPKAVAQTVSIGGILGSNSKSVLKRLNWRYQGNSLIRLSLKTGVAGLVLVNAFAGSESSVYESRAGKALGNQVRTGTKTGTEIGFSLGRSCGQHFPTYLGAVEVPTSAVQNVVLRTVPSIPPSSKLPLYN